MARSIAQALADGYQPAMMVMAAPCAVAAVVTGLLVSDNCTAAPGPRCRQDATAAPCRSWTSGDNLIQEEA